MATLILSQCGIRPLPPIFAKPRTGLISKSIQNNACSQRNIFSNEKNTDFDFTLYSASSSNGISRSRKWVSRVSAPSKIAFFNADEEETINGVNGAEDDNEFDYGSPPPFKLGDIRAAIPKHCWVKDTWRSMSYVARDVAIVFGLAAAALYLNKWYIWPLYWVAQGTVFWALFVLGHDWYIFLSFCFIFVKTIFIKDPYHLKCIG